MRGIRNKGHMVTSEIRGVLFTNPDARNEFLSFVNMEVMNE